MRAIMTIMNRYPKKHGKTLEELAELMGYENASTLGRHLNPDDAARPFPLMKIIPLIMACNSDCSVLDRMESMVGRVAITIPGTKASLDSNSVALLAKESGEAISTYASALADGDINRTEKEESIRELTDLAQACMGLIQALNKI